MEAFSGVVTGWGVCVQAPVGKVLVAGTVDLFSDDSQVDFEVVNPISCTTRGHGYFAHPCYNQCVRFC